MTENTQRLEAAVRASIDCYNCILKLLRDADDKIGTANGEYLDEIRKSLASLQVLSVKYDQSVQLLLLVDPSIAQTVQKFLSQREVVLKDIVDLNKKISTKAIGVQSVLAHEMSSVRNGMSALSGYRQQQDNQGRIINSTL